MTVKLDILFVHPNASATIYQGLSNQHSAIEPPIWAAMLANSVRSAGYSTAILDAEAFGWTNNMSILLDIFEA